MKINIVSDIQEVGHFNVIWENNEISNEPMFYRADYEFAYQNGGPITRHFLRMLPYSWQNTSNALTIDSRVHMLMPGWYPCIPGMHHDDVPRTRSDGQPNYEAENQVQHLMGLVGAEIAPTEFALGEIELEVPPEGQLIYRDWHPKVMQAIEVEALKSFKCKSGAMYQFDSGSFHQGTAAVKAGWRWFIRVSRFTERALDCKNEIRKQVQVYMESPMEGW